MTHRIVNPDTLARPVGYAHGVLAEGRLLFVGGQIGWDAQGRLADGFVAQFDRALANVVEVLRAAGAAPEHVARLTIYVTDKKRYLADLKEVGRRYREHLGRHYPAMALVQVADLLEDGALVEIEATAVVPAPR